MCKQKGKNGSGWNTLFSLTFGPTHATVCEKHFFNKGSLITFPSFSSQMADHSFPFWTYIQFRHILGNPKLASQRSRQHTPFESMCLKTEPQNIFVMVKNYNLVQGYLLLFLIRKCECACTLEANTLTCVQLSYFHTSVLLQGGANVLYRENNRLYVIAMSV